MDAELFEDTRYEAIRQITDEGKKPHEVILVLSSVISYIAEYYIGEDD